MVSFMVSFMEPIPSFMLSFIDPMPSFMLSFVLLLDPSKPDFFVLLPEDGMLDEELFFPEELGFARWTFSG